MADDSTPVKQNLDFHSCNVPYGIPTFKLDDLSPEQQSYLNEIRIQKIRVNEIYLAAHPEVRAIIIIILKKLLINRPRRNIHGFISNVLRKNYVEITDEIEKYLGTRINHKSERTSGLKIHKDEISHESTASASIEEETTSLEYIQGIIENIRDVAIERSPGPIPKDVKLIMSEILDDVIFQINCNERRDKTESQASSFRSIHSKPLGSELRTKGKFKIQGPSLEFLEQLSLQPSILTDLLEDSRQEVVDIPSPFAALLARQQQQDEEDNLKERNIDLKQQQDEEDNLKERNIDLKKVDDENLGEEEYDSDGYKMVYEDIYEDLDRNWDMNLQVHSQDDLDEGSAIGNGEIWGNMSEDEGMTVESATSSSIDKEEY